MEISLSESEDPALSVEVTALCLDDEILGRVDTARLGVLRARHPALAILAVLEPGPHLPRRSFQLSYAGVDEVVIRGTEDHANRVCEAFSRAALRSVARVVEWGCAPAPALRRIQLLRRAGDLARALGYPLSRFRGELRALHLFPPRQLLAHTHLLYAARRLGNAKDSLERIGLEAGYASLAALDNASRRLWHTTPSEIRTGGGLGFGALRFRGAASGWRDRGRRRAAP